MPKRSSSRPVGAVPRPKRSAGKKPPKYKPYTMRLPQAFWLVPFAFLIGFGTLAAFFGAEEIKTSKLQASYLSAMAEEIRFELKDGADPLWRVPLEGPYNQRLGYSYLPYYVKVLETGGYAIARQMHASQRYHDLLSYGFYPVYRAKTVAGLSVLDRYEQPLYSTRYPTHVFAGFHAIPPLLVSTLLFIENRELLDPGPVTRNPVVEWKRFLYAAAGHILKRFSPGLNAGGGSTLATQIEKFRYSPGGQTGSAMDKIRQIVSASFRVYMDGPDTRAARERIVLDYLNSTPLSGRAGFGEINGLGDGLWAWFGRQLEDMSSALNLPETDADSLRVKATAYREALSLILAQRRPSYYLLTDRSALDDLTDATLDRLAANGVISYELRKASRQARLRFLAEAPPPTHTSFLDQKASNVLRTHLLNLLGLKKLYELDRIDLTASSTLDQDVQRNMIEFLKKMSDPVFVESAGLYGFRLLKPDNDPAKIKWSVVLYERSADANRLRVQADNIDGPFDMNEGVKLDLGSTAKLRTLVTYLEMVGELYRRYAGLADEDLRVLADDAPDVLTSWATTWLRANPDATLDDMLEAAMNRKYSASPAETFFTGGGAHQFVNFQKEDNGRILPVREALRNSVNLVFIRMMRDIVNYTIGQGRQTREELLSDPDHPARREYLERFADREGSVFLNRYITDYANLTPDQMLEKAAGRSHKSATARTILFRSARPGAGFADYAAFMSRAMSDEIDGGQLRKLFRDYPAERYNLSDRAYITGLNPLELWLVSYKNANPSASRKAILAVSRPVRIESYTWLFHPRKQGAQNTRIRVLLEQDAFARIQQRWARLGYPFEKLVPSLATSIGSSADKPGALAELVGILLNDGVKKPSLRFETFHFAPNTPYETILKPAEGRSIQVLDPAIAKIVCAAMADVVENGTAKRLRGAYLDSAGRPLTIGGKTGTGDHRYDEYAAGGRLISSRVVNRTGTIVFYIGNRFFGTVTAHVAGADAANYVFTSALSAQMLKALAPVLQPLVSPGAGAPTEAPLAAPGAAAAKWPAPRKDGENEPGEDAIGGQDIPAAAPRLQNEESGDGENMDEQQR